MSLRTSRAHAPAEVVIDRARCNSCGLCTKVCNMTLVMVAGELTVDQSRLWGCIGCGQCVAVCPEDAIRVEGRDFRTTDAFPIPSREDRTGYNDLLNLFHARRSIRRFRPPEISPALIERIINAASTAPMGVPPSDVSLLVFRSREKVREFAADLRESMRRMRWMFSGPGLLLLRPMLGKEGCESFKEFVGPLVDTYLEKHAGGTDMLFYDAPLAIYFYGSPYADPADPIIAATYAMLAAEALGVGSCMIGLPGPCIKNDRKLREEYGIPKNCQPGIVIVFGYADVKFKRAVHRRFAQVRYM